MNLAGMSATLTSILDEQHLDNLQGCGLINLQRGLELIETELWVALLQASVVPAWRAR